MAVGLVAGGLAVDARQAVAEPDQRDAYRTDGALLAKDVGISRAEGERRLRLQEAAGSLEQIARDRWPETFGGLWIDHRDGGAISIAFTEDATGKVDSLGTDFVRPDLLRAVDVARPLSSLEATQRLMVSDRDQVRAGTLSLPAVGDGQYDLNIDIRRNVVVATVEQDAATVASLFQLRYGPDVIVEEGSAGQPLCTRDNCGTSLRSGLKVTNDSGSWCSTAFSGRRWSSEWAVLSAAHCDHDSVTGQWAKHGGTYYGYAHAQQQSGPVDAEFHRVVYNGFSAQASIMINTSETARQVKAKGSYAGLATGSYVCKSGATTNTSCGYVSSKWGAPWWVTGSYNFIEASVCSEGGDSGSGVYSAYKALGIISGGSTALCSSSSDWSYFGHIEYAEDALSVDVTTTDSAPYFSSVAATAGDDEITAYFSESMDCWSLQAGDFTARMVVGGVSQPLNVTSVGTSCFWDSASGTYLTSAPRLRVNLSGAPVAFAPGTSVSVTLTGIVQDRWGNEAYRPSTRSASVTI